MSHATAAAELHTLARNFAAQQHDNSYRGWDLNLYEASHFQRGLFSVIGEQLPVLLGASVLLMVLVCMNIASLLGQHAARRRREIAIRTALGAAPTRIAVQVFTETGLLALAGGFAGWAASTGMSRALFVLLPNFGFPLAFNLHSDPRILLFVTAVVMAVTLICGMYPVRQSLRVSQREALHEGGAAVAGDSRRRFGRRILLGLQLGICFVVLVCCGLLTRTAFNVFSRDTGFNRANVLTASIDLSRSGYSQDRGLAFQAALFDKLRNAPGVDSATLTTHLPMGDPGSGNTRGFSIPGYVPAKGEDMEVITDFDGPDFFHTTGIQMQQGRDFARSDVSGSPLVAIVSESMARRYWPKGNALGSMIVVDKLQRRVVGVVRDYAYHNPEMADPELVVFLPLLQGPAGYGYVLIAIRSRTTAGAVTAQLRQAVASLDGALPLEDVRTLEDVTANSIRCREFRRNCSGCMHCRVCWWLCWVSTPSWLTRSSSATASSRCAWHWDPHAPEFFDWC